jgi:hypothetical protein
VAEKEVEEVERSLYDVESRLGDYEAVVIAKSLE